MKQTSAVSYFYISVGQIGEFYFTLITHRTIGLTGYIGPLTYQRTNGQYRTPNLNRNPSLFAL